MNLKSCKFNHDIFLPDGGGGTNGYVREPSYEIVLEAACVRIRSRNRTNGQKIKVPLANVACYDELSEETAPRAAGAKS